MNKNPLITVINMILCFMLFFIEIFYLTFFTINKGIKKEEVLNYINNIDIKEILTTTKIHDEIQKEINLDKETIDKIMSSPQIETYIKDNTKQLYLALFYKEEIPNITSNDIINLVNNNIDDIVGESNLEITEEKKQEIIELAKKLSHDIEANMTNIDEIKIEFNNYRKIISTTIPNILVVLIMITSTIIIIINRNSHDYLLWLGLPTLISGILFLIFALSLNGTLNFVQIDNSIYITINKWFSSIIKNLINTSAFTIIIGLISTIMYIILKLKKQKDSVI